MLAGYVTYKELLIITGYPPAKLNALIKKGLNQKELKVGRLTDRYKLMLFDIQEVEEWIRMYTL